MKKLAKLAALLAAGALALGFAACSGDDDNDPPKKPEVTATATLTGSAGMLKIGEPEDVKAKLTVDGDTFIDGDIKSSIELTAGAGVTATVKTAEKSADKKSAELTISVRAAEGAQDGAITAKIKADALTDTSEPVTAAGSITYQIDDGTPYAVLELDGNAVELDPEAEEPKEINAIVTVGNTEFTEAARELPEGNEIPEEYFKLSASDEKVTVSKAKVVAWGEDGKSVKISFTATADDGAKDGTITAEIYAGTLKDVSEPLKTGSIAYTVKSATQTDPNPDEGDDTNVPHKDVIIDVSDLSNLTNDEVADGEALSPEANIKAVGALTVDGNSGKKSTFAGKEISPSKRLKLDGKISSKGLEVNLAGDATILVYAYSGTSGSARSLALYDADKQIIDGTTQGIGTGNDNILNVAVFEVKANTTYYIGAVDSGINIYYIAVLGTFTEEAAETVEAKAATCTEAGNPAYTLTDYGRYILEDGKAVPSSGITTPALGHDYTGVTPQEDTLPTENTEGKFTAACARDCGHTQDIVLPELTDPSYTRTGDGASSGKYKYSYTDKATGLTVTFEADQVEQGAEKVKYLIGFDSAIQDKNDYGVDEWEVSGYKDKANIVVDGVTYAKGVKLNSTGYVTIVIKAEAKVTFYINGEQTLKCGDIETGNATKYSTDVYTVTATLSAGKYKVVRGGSAEIALACLVIEPTDQ